MAQAAITAVAPPSPRRELWHQYVAMAVMVVLLAAAPLFVYPVFMMGVLCFALFASAFNLLLGFGGLLSFGHAAYFGMAGYVTAHCAKVWGLQPALSILVRVVAAAAPLHPGRGRPGRPPRHRHRRPRHPPPGHLLRHDHAGAGPDGLLLLPPG